MIDNHTSNLELVLKQLCDIDLFRLLNYFKDDREDLEFPLLPNWMFEYYINKGEVEILIHRFGMTGNWYKIFFPIAKCIYENNEEFQNIDTISIIYQDYSNKIERQKYTIQEFLDFHLKNNFNSISARYREYEKFTLPNILNFKNYFNELENLVDEVFSSKEELVELKDDISYASVSFQNDFKHIRFLITIREDSKLLSNLDWVILVINKYYENTFFIRHNDLDRYDNRIIEVKINVCPVDEGENRFLNHENVTIIKTRPNYRLNGVNSVKDIISNKHITMTKSKHPF